MNMNYRTERHAALASAEWPDTMPSEPAPLYTPHDRLDGDGEWSALGLMLCAVSAVATAAGIAALLAWMFA